MQYSTGDGFELLSDEMFDKMSTVVPAMDDTANNYCQDCPDTLMVPTATEYQCPLCGQVRYDVQAEKNTDDAVNNSIRVTTGSSKGRFYTVTGDYSKTQKKYILEQLYENHNLHNENAFPKEVLVLVADAYNMIQKHITEDEVDDNGDVVGQKKFVRRGNIKDEVLGALMYFKCIEKGITRKKKDIATFMKLPTHGFSRGEDILRNLHAEGKIDIPIDDEPIEGFIDRYLEALNIEDNDYHSFVKEIVERSELKNIGMNSQLSSKVVGAIWIIITQRKLKIRSDQLEQAADNTKKNTFSKFHTIVLKNISKFRDIFVKYKIPYYQ
jgi:hypothetical protein